MRGNPRLGAVRLSGSASLGAEASEPKAEGAMRRGRAPAFQLVKNARHGHVVLLIVYLL